MKIGHQLKLLLPALITLNTAVFAQGIETETNHATQTPSLLIDNASPSISGTAAGSYASMTLAAVPMPGVPIPAPMIARPSLQNIIVPSKPATPSRQSKNPSPNKQAKRVLSQQAKTLNQANKSKQAVNKTKQSKPGKSVTNAELKGTKKSVQETEKAVEVKREPKPTDIISSVKVESNVKGEKWVALTFDDGPSPQYTPQILAILKEHGIHATFCVVGRQVKKCPELVQQIVAEGHKLANHTMNHDEQLSFKALKKMKTEILGEKALLETVVPGTEVEFYRAPAGNWNYKIRKQVAAWGMKPLGWTVDTNDWQKPGTEEIVSHVEKYVQPGGVVLMHDGGGDRSESVAALKKIIPSLKASGYHFGFPG